MPSATRIVAAALASAALVSAHGFVTNAVINGAYVEGFLIHKHPYMENPPTVNGWKTTATDTGFVSPDAYGSPDIVCHRGSENAQGIVEVAAGDSIYLQWNTWPRAHHGPVLDYLARCGSAGCGAVDKTTLEFFKIAEAGLVEGNNVSGTPGLYASDDLIDNGKGWMVKIPPNIACGDYVLRHEIISLHASHQENGAQHYPQCFNIRVTGSGTDNPPGVRASQLYKPDDEGISLNIYVPSDNYTIPGPPLIEGAQAPVLASSAVASTATATPVGEGGSCTPLPTSTSPSASTDARPTSEPTAQPTQPPSEGEPEKPACPARRRKHKRSKKNKRSKKAKRSAL